MCIVLLHYVFLIHKGGVILLNACSVRHVLSQSVTKQYGTPSSVFPSSSVLGELSE